MLPAEMACPSMDLIELIGILYAWAPKAVLKAAVSQRSVNGRELPWALT
jgi:hypothetical protein